MIGQILSGDGGRRTLWIVGLAVALGVAGWLWLGERRVSSPLDSPAASASVELIAPRGSVGASPARFEWKPFAGASSYQVRIADADSVWPIFVRASDSTVLLLGPEESTALTPGRIHEWTVEARGQDGATLATGSAQFRVEMPGAGSDRS